MRIDMHMHSTASDGQYTPTELVRQVKDAGIAIMALTDHDSIGGVEEAVRTAKECGIICIPGIELSIDHENELHMLGYGIDIHDRELKAFCEEMVQERSTRNEKIITFLADQGVDVTMEEVAEKAGSDVIGRPHFARVMVEKGYVSSVKEAFDKYLATEEFSKIERKKPSARQGTSMIRKAGGVAVLAHPVSLKKTGEAMEEEIRKLASLGLSGIETYYSTHTPEQIQEYHALAQKYHLVETAGSDFHGEKVKPTIFLGKKEGGKEWLVDKELEQ